MLGLDAVFNYKIGSLAESLREAAPDGIDVYFDNVGGDHLEAAIGALRRFGRVVMCGTISEYEQAEPAPGPRNLFLAVAKELTLRGLRGNTYSHLMPELWQRWDEWVREGRIKTQETIIDGLENAPLALASLLCGETLRQDAGADRRGWRAMRALQMVKWQTPPQLRDVELSA